MAYDIDVSPAACRDLKKLSKQVILRIDAALLALEQTPRPLGSKKLGGMEAWRLRVGDFRILYTINDKAQTLTIERVLHRKDAY